MFAWLSRRLSRLLSAVRGRPATGRAAPADRLGPRSELLARAFLERAGFRILAANYRCPMGELDLVAEGEGRLVFVEVKARRAAAVAAGSPAAMPVRPERAVNRAKQRKIGRAARYYCRACRKTDMIVRFDVIAIDWPADDGDPVVRHHPGAFRPERTRH
jgi:putative endonuclease